MWKAEQLQLSNLAMESLSLIASLPVADELVRLKVDVLVATTTPAALAAKNATRVIPIIFVGVGDPVASGLVDSLARPGGNATGTDQHFGGVIWQAAGVTQGIRPPSSHASRCCGIPEAPGSPQWKESQLPSTRL